MAKRLSALIEGKKAKAAVIGLGYVGLPLSVEISKAGFDVTGLDVDPEKAAAINQGRSHIADVPDDEVAAVVGGGRLRATADHSFLSEVDVVSLCVPTPLRKTRDPDLTYVVRATETIAEHLHPGMLIILESTTYPGTTREVVQPILERTGLRVGTDIFLCFSPERVDPGNASFQTRNIPKVIGGVTPNCTEVGCRFYAKVMDSVVPVSSAAVAEMVKLLENTFRMINIGLVNEMATICREMGVDIWEVIDAAATKPFGFMPFYPGPGLGGHCIPIDPLYLSWKIRQVGMEPRFIQLASEISGEMPSRIVRYLQGALNDVGKPVKGSKVHLVGVAYKRDVSDMRESPALDISAQLIELGATITYSDPHVPSFTIGGQTLSHAEISTAASEADISLIVTDHRAVDYSLLVRSAPLILDTRNVLKSFAEAHIVRL